MEKNIYELFGLSPIDDPKSQKSLRKIKSEFIRACQLSDSSNFFKLLEAANILLDDKQRAAYVNDNPTIQKQLRKEMLKRKIEEITLKKIVEKLPAGCFIEDLDFDSSYYDKPRVSITISKPTGKWVVLCADLAVAYGESATHNYESPGAPYFNSGGYWGCNSFGVEDKDKNMPEYISDFFGCPILMATPKKNGCWESRELHVVSNATKIEQLKKDGISLVAGTSSRFGGPAKRMIVSTLDINYSFPSKKITDNDIDEYESLLDQIEVVSSLRRVEMYVVSEDGIIINNPAVKCVKHFIKHYALNYHTRWDQLDSKEVIILQMGVPVNKFEAFKAEAATHNINFVDYGEMGEGQPIDEIGHVSDPKRRK